MAEQHEQSDEEIAVAVQGGDIEAFGALVDRYDAKLHRYAKKFLLNFDDADDLVQDVFLKTYQNIRDFDASRRFSPWIYRIAHNEFVNALKKRINSPVGFFDPDVIFPQQVSSETADYDANLSETRKLLDTYLNKLDAKYREPIILYFYEELSYQEIADVLQVPVSTVGVRIARGKSQLRSVIDKQQFI